MKRVMIDIETLDSKYSSVILSIAVIEFDINSPRSYRTLLNIYLPTEPQIMEGRTISADTCKWWMTQSPNAQLAMAIGRKTAEETGITLEVVRRELIEALDGADEIWANGPDFDCIILRDFLGYDFKWRFWAHRCARTFFRMFDYLIEPEAVTNKLGHDALADCVYQAEKIAHISLALRAKGISIE